MVFVVFAYDVFLQISKCLAHVNIRFDANINVFPEYSHGDLTVKFVALEGFVLYGNCCFWLTLPFLHLRCFVYHITAFLQVDILISKNQALQMLCLKHYQRHAYKSSWIRNLMISTKIWSHKIIIISNNCRILQLTNIRYNIKQLTHMHLITGQPSKQLAV